jgi:hypothetical protein
MWRLTRGGSNWFVLQDQVAEERRSCEKVCYRCCASSDEATSPPGVWVCLMTAEQTVHPG